jgi:hypothetical protein
VDTPTDPVVAELRKLREGAGLTLERLERSGAVMSALGTADPQEAYRRLVAVLQEIEPAEQANALRVDLGVDIDALLTRLPVQRERRWLGDRRSAYAEVIGRDVKTLARWSNRAVIELRSRLLTDYFSGDLLVIAAVEGGRITMCSFVQVDADEDEPKRSRTTEFRNPSKDWSLPCMVYAFPRDWRPRSLTLVAAFRDEPYPEEVAAVVATDFMNLMFADQRYPLAVHEAMATCRIENPRRDRLYAIYWERNGSKLGEST